MHLHAILLAIGTVAVRHAISQRELRLWMILFFYVGAGRPIYLPVRYTGPHCKEGLAAVWRARCKARGDVIRKTAVSLQMRVQDALQAR